MSPLAPPAPPKSPRILVHRARSRSRRRSVSSDSDSSSASDYDFELPAEDRKNAAIVAIIDSSRKKRIQIHSPHLIKAIKHVNKHPPLQPITDYLMEVEPYPILYYHLQDIRDEIDKLNDEEARLDLEALEEVAEAMKPRWERARQETFESGLVRYDMLWKLFHAGDLLVHKDSIGCMWMFVLAEVVERKHDMQFLAWYLAWEGMETQLKRRSVILNLSDYGGEKPIESLPLYPVRFAERRLGQDFKSSLAARGRQWHKLIAERTSCLKFDDLAIFVRGRPNHPGELPPPPGLQSQTERRMRINERVVIDSEAKAVSATETLTNELNGSKSKNPAIEIDYRPQYLWDDLPLETELTDEQAMLCPPVIGCFGVTSKQLVCVSVEKLQPVDWDTDAMKRLVLDNKKKDMLSGLVGQHYSPGQQGMRSDLIVGKGQSLVILLHGPPGVGKTLTAECVAEAVKKPLIALSIGDLVWDERLLQGRLAAEFKRAREWDAVLLLDEADIVLEARSFEDVRRNGIVSIFLRQLEYYQGVLFLTTNRVSTMDPAFQSRIQIGIAFKPMTTNIRAQVWDQLLALNDRAKTIGPMDVRDVREKLSKYELNGRQIRNVLNVAEGLAFNQYGEKGMLKYRHIEEAVESAVEFQKLLESARSNLKTEQTVWAPYHGDNDDIGFM